MRSLAAVALLAICGMLALGRGSDDARDAEAGAGAGPSRSAPGIVAESPSCPEPHDPVWVAIDVDDTAAGGVIEYFGKADRWAIDALIDGSLEGYLRLDEVFWLFEDGEVERLDEDVAYGGTSYFRADGIRRITPLKDEFPEAARQLSPGDRIVPAAGRDA